jgi:hypothetical protein
LKWKVVRKCVLPWQYVKTLTDLRWGSDRKLCRSRLGMYVNKHRTTWTHFSIIGTCVYLQNKFWLMNGKFCDFLRTNY